MPLADTDWERISIALTEHGLRRTLRRRAIVEAAQAAEGYFDADTLYASARRIDPHVSRATVYRTLTVLCDFGWLHQTDFGEGHHRYRRREPAQPPTVEIFIVDCGSVIEQPAPFLTWYEETIAAQRGLTFVDGRFQIFARCTHKSAGGSCSHCPQGLKETDRRPATDAHPTRARRSR